MVMYVCFSFGKRNFFRVNSLSNAGIFGGFSQGEVSCTKNRKQYPRNRTRELGKLKP